MNVATFWRAGTPQLFVDVDREKAKALGVSIDAAFATLSACARVDYVAGPDTQDCFNNLPVVKLFGSGDLLRAAVLQADHGPAAEAIAGRHRRGRTGAGLT